MWEADLRRLRLRLGHVANDLSGTEGKMEAGCFEQQGV